MFEKTLKRLEEAFPVKGDGNPADKFRQKPKPVSKNAYPTIQALNKVMNSQQADKLSALGGKLGSRAFDVNRVGNKLIAQIDMSVPGAAQALNSGELEHEKLTWDDHAKDSFGMNGDWVPDSKIGK